MIFIMERGTQRIEIDIEVQLRESNDVVFVRVVC